MISISNIGEITREGDRPRRRKLATYPCFVEAVDLVSANSCSTSVPIAMPWDLPHCRPRSAPHVA
jgi:hypothetical protein